ncbi:hypothetical protein DFQ28_009742 [Apophysomyces sp. BC1034]|nr:hypothetical protein DFQ30_005945 [Apophysomyces sp. BC1015]KAG0182344.1 hypothetical protein DFQ29_004584 [Apophysomyces sp. BC1021]KAG0194535.1 hypothetical protein DFQ28_009742 [Apophysomyces sp. BC1034]
MQNVPPSELEPWMQRRRIRSLSVPDMNRLRREWVDFQNNAELQPDRIQVDLLNVRTETPLKRPIMRVKMGSSQYYSSRAKLPVGDWNEGFVFMASYHTQLFDTVEFDLYDKPRRRWPSKTVHIGKAKLKLSKLAGRDDVFVTFLPVYEYHARRSLPADIRDMLMNSNVALKHATNARLIGSVQIRIRYKFQHPAPNISKAIAPIINTTDDRRQSSTSTHTATHHPSQHGRGGLAKDEFYIDSVFKDRLDSIMNTQVPGSESNLLQNKQLQHHRLAKRQPPRTWWQKVWPSHPAQSLRGQRYGFSQNDIEDADQVNKDESPPSPPSPPPPPAEGTVSHIHRIKDKARKKARHIIYSVNFGDKNFGTQWMQNSFDDVALAHPTIDHLIGLVVSKQTRALVRAIIKMVNAFGQGFKVTSFGILKALLVLQKYYQSLPKTAPSFEIKDRAMMNEACHYFNHALIAYGWRGLCYLGAYGQYIRGARNRRSNKTAIIRYLKIPSEDLLGYEYGLRKGAAFQPSYFVSIDRERNSIVLSIRGTWSLYDAITDLVCEYKPWKGGLVHSGMLASAQWFYTEIVPQIFRYIHDHQELASFIITGHSLGGGTASLLTMMVADHVEELRELSHNPSFRLHCFSYAPVASCSPELRNQYTEYIHSFTVQDDVVGRLSYGTAMELKELVVDTITAYNALGGWYKVMTDPKIRALYFDIIDKRRARILSQVYPLLYIPGEIIHIRRRDVDHRIRLGVHFSAHSETSAISNEMFLSTTCITDHMINSYQHAFDQLRANYPLT